MSWEICSKVRRHQSRLIDGSHTPPLLLRPVYRSYELPNDPLLCSLRLCGFARKVGVGRGIPLNEDVTLSNIIQSGPQSDCLVSPIKDSTDNRPLRPGRLLDAGPYRAVSLYLLSSA